MNCERKTRDLKRRVAAFEFSFAGTALHISAVHKDLLAFQARMERRFDRASGRFDTIDDKFDRIELELHRLRADMSKIVRRAVRDTRRNDARTKR